MEFFFLRVNFTSREFFLKVNFFCEKIVIFKKKKKNYPRKKPHKKILRKKLLTPQNQPVIVFVFTKKIFCKKNSSRKISLSFLRQLSFKGNFFKFFFRIYFSRKMFCLGVFSTVILTSQFVV